MSNASDTSTKARSSCRREKESNPVHAGRSSAHIDRDRWDHRYGTSHPFDGWQIPGDRWTERCDGSHQPSVWLRSSHSNILAVGAEYVIGPLLVADHVVRVV